MRQEVAIRSDKELVDTCLGRSGFGDRRYQARGRVCGRRRGGPFQAAPRLIEGVEKTSKGRLPGIPWPVDAAGALHIAPEAGPRFGAKWPVATARPHLSSYCINGLMRSSLAPAVGALCLALGFHAVPVDAQEERSADELAREMSNPVGSLASLTLQGSWTRWGGSAQGAGDQSASSLVFMPTLPFKLWGGNLVVRPSFPVAGLPTLNDDLDWEKKRGFGDIVLVSNWGKKTESGVLWSVGATSVFPTAAEGLGKDQFQLGPAAILGVLKPWGVLGIFWQHWWGVNAREGEEAVNIGNLQLFYYRSS